MLDQPDNRTVRHFFRAGGMLVMCALLWASGSTMVVSADDDKKDPLDVKVVWLKHFSDYVEWPQKRFASEDAPFVLGVIGKNPFGQRLEEMASRQQMHKRRVEIRLIGETDEIRHCHMLFVCASESERLPSILKAAQQHSVLTVSDMDGFTSRGGMIQLCQVEDKIRFEINQAKGAAARLGFDARFCNLSRQCQKEEGAQP